MSGKLIKSFAEIVKSMLKLITLIFCNTIYMVINIVRGNIIEWRFDYDKSLCNIFVNDWC
jgi:hypothetical protein